MTAEVRFAVDAVRDLADLYRFIAPRGGETVARAYVARLHGYCLGLGEHPARGVARDDIRPRLRLLAYRRQATIAYVADGTTVTVLRVFGRGQDVLSALEEP